MWLRFPLTRLLSSFFGVFLILFVTGVSYASPVNTEPIKVGILHSLTGTMAISERSLVDAAKLAIDEINQNGGVLGRRIVPIIEDGASDWPTFARKAEKLIVADQVSSIFGGWTSSSRKEILPVIEKYQNLLWYPVQYEGYESSPYVIYTGAAPNQQIIPAMEWSLEHLGKKVFLVGSDYVFPKTANKIVKEYLAAHGGVCVGEEYLPLGDKNFQQIIEKIKEAKPDFIFNTVNGDSNIGLFLDLNKEGIGPDDIPVMSVSIAEDELRSIGTAMTAGHYAAWNYFQSINTPENLRFVEAFKRAYGMDRVTDDPIEAAYFQVHLFAKAVTKAGSTDPKAIRDAARELVFSAPGGLVRIDSTNQHTWKTVRIGRIQQDGQFEIVWNSKKPIEPDPYLKLTSSERSSIVNVNISEPDAVNTLIEALNNGNTDARQDAARLLGELGPKARAATAALEKALYDDNWLISYYSAKALAQIGSSTVPTLIDAIKHDNNLVRLFAIQALGQIGSDAKEASPSLIDLLKSNDTEIRQEVVKALASVGIKSEETVPALVERLGDEDTSVQLFAIDALGRIGGYAKDALPALVKKLNSDNEIIRLRITKAIAKIAQELEALRETELIPDLNEALKAMTRQGINNSDVVTVGRAIDHLNDIKKAERPNVVLPYLVNNKWLWVVGAYLLAYLVLWLVGLHLFPLRLLRANIALRLIAIRLPVWLSGIQAPLRYLFLVGFFQNHSKVLDAWVKANVGPARRNFAEMEAFKPFGIYIPIPIRIEEKRVNSTSPREFDHTTNRTRWCILIQGDGGTGKTALAYQIALWAMRDDQHERLNADHIMLPVLIEPGLNPNAIRDTDSLKDAILGQLRAYIDTNEAMPEDFFEHLLQKQRIVVIIDDLSSSTYVSWALPGDKDFPVAAMVVTSRSSQKLGGVPVTGVEPLTIEGELLYVFLEDYMRKREKRPGFTDVEFYDACKRLSDITKGKTTALFAKMYAEYLISMKENQVWIAFPRDIPELMLGYMNVLNRGRQTTDPDDRTVHKVSKLVAWECLKGSYHPSTASRNAVLATLTEFNAETILTYLEDRLMIIRTIGAEKNLVRFTIDPLAEYLAALHLVDIYGGDENLWSQFLDKSDSMNGPRSDINEFLLVVRDCCQSTVHGVTLPSFLLDKLTQRAGLTSEKVKEKPIKVGILHSLSGTMAISEHSLVYAAELAIDEINQNGGVLGRRIVPIIEDGASDWPTFARKAEKLIVEDGVSSVFGCWTSASRKEVLPVFEKHHHLLWYPVQYEGYESSPYVIYTGAAPNQQIIPAMEWSLEHLGKKVFLVGSDYVFPKTANKIVKEYLAAHGGVCVGEEYLPLGDKNFQQIIEKIKEAKPDFIFNTVNGDSNIGLFLNMNEVGISPDNIPVMSVSIAEDELRSIGTAMTAGHYAAWNYFQSIDTPENRHFVEAFKRTYGMDRVTDDPIEAAYFQVHLFAKAVTKAGSTDPRAIRDAARGLVFSAPGGLVSIDPTNQHTWKTARIGRILQNGQFEIIWSSEKAIEPDPYLRKS